MTPEHEKELRARDLCQTSRELLAALDEERRAHEETRRERDEYQACWHRDVAKGRAAVESAERETEKRNAALERAVARADQAEQERDEALASYEALRETAADVIAYPVGHGAGADYRRARARMERTLAATPAALSAQYRARVRAEALRESADRTGEAVRTESGWYGITDGQERHTAEWLRALADAAEKGTP